ncbi:MAG: Ig-like domain repeat protein [Isosphaeraceae bacterium]
MRLTPSTGSATWTGAVDSDWSNPGNWSGDTAPLPGYDLIFPANVTTLNAVNDFPSGTSFNSITIEAPDYNLSGNGVVIASSLGTTYTSGTATALDISMTGQIILVASGGTLDLSLGVSSTPQLNLSGGGTLDLEGQSSYSGTTTIAGPATTLLVDNTIGTVENTQGVLGGNGTVGTVTNIGGTVSPGHSPSPGVLTTGSLSLDSNSTFVADLDGTSPGNGSTGYNQVVAGGSVSLDNAALDASIGPDYTPTPGDALTIIQNNSGTAVTGNFAGDLEGGAVTVGNSLFRINYQGGNSGDNVVLTNVSYTSSVTISPSSSSTIYGQSVTMTATVTGGDGGTPTGTVAFYDGNPSSGGTELGTPVALSGGVATDPVDLDALGSPHQVYAVYIPDPTTDTYAGSTSTTPATVIVAPATLTVSGITVNSKVYDSTTTATLDTSSAVLSGVLNGDTVSVSPSGYTATYSSPDAGTGIPVTVTGLSLTGADAGNYVLTQPTNLTGDITQAPLTLTANDQTIIETNPIPTLTFSASGLQGNDTLAVLTSQPSLSTSATSSSPPGSYPININGGTAANYTITDVPGNLTIVANQQTTTTVTSSSPLAVAGQPVTFTAEVTPVVASTEAPTGSVTFYANASPIGTGTLDAATGVATFTDSSLRYGSYSIQAVYSGDLTFGTSTSSAISQFITSAGTQPMLTVVAVRNSRGKIVAAELVADIGVTAPGSGTPLGNAVFFVNGRASYQIAPVVDGKATLTLLPPRVENKLIYFRYLGYYNIFQPSASTSQLVSRRSLAYGPSVTEAVTRAALSRESADVQQPVKVVKVLKSRDHRRHF